MSSEEIEGSSESVLVDELGRHVGRRCLEEAAGEGLVGGVDEARVIPDPEKIHGAS